LPGRIEPASVWRRHLFAAVLRLSAMRSATDGALTVGFADLVGCTAFSPLRAGLSGAEILEEGLGSEEQPIEDLLGVLSVALDGLRHGPLQMRPRLGAHSFMRLVDELHVIGARTLHTELRIGG
jgi:hypothetical protein